MSLATSRSRRANAGAKMAQLLDKEEEDDFYKNAYGGFTEENDDNEFEIKESESEDEDVIDSDFDKEENESKEQNLMMEVDEEEDNDDETSKKPKKRNHKGVNTKAYKEPNQDSKITKNEDKLFEVVEEKNVEVKSKRIKKERIEAFGTSTENKTLRISTEKKRLEVKERQEEREARKRLKSHKKSKNEGRRLTQEELLEEAKLTEQLNLASLDAYNKMELEKKKTKFIKSVAKGPLIRYHSVAMPVCTSDGVRENETNEKQARNFITFSDECSFKNTFPKQKTNTIPQKICVITGLPAKYFDPVTKSPYANLYAFKVLRETHQKNQKEIITTES
jgi:vacuolar protein sorting-associated protein 72